MNDPSATSFITPTKQQTDMFTLVPTDNQNLTVCVSYLVQVCKCFMFREHFYVCFFVSMLSFFFCFFLEPDPLLLTTSSPTNTTTNQSRTHFVVGLCVSLILLVCCWLGIRILIKKTAKERSVVRKFSLCPDTTHLIRIQFLYI